MEDKGKGRDGEENFTIKVKTRDSQVREVNVHRDWSIPKLKDELEKSTGVSPSQMRLIYCGKVLKDDPETTIGSYGIKGDQTIHLVAKASNAPESSPSPSAAAAAASSSNQFPNATTATYSFGPGQQVSVTQFTTDGAIENPLNLMRSIMGGIPEFMPENAPPPSAFTHVPPVNAMPPTNPFGAPAAPAQPAGRASGGAQQQQGLNFPPNGGTAFAAFAPAAPGQAFSPYAPLAGQTINLVSAPHVMPVIQSINLNITASVSELADLPGRLESLMHRIPFAQTAAMTARPVTAVTRAVTAQPAQTSVQMSWGTGQPQARVPAQAQQQQQQQLRQQQQHPAQQQQGNPADDAFGGLFRGILQAVGPMLAQLEGQQQQPQSQQQPQQQPQQHSQQQPQQRAPNQGSYPNPFFQYQQSRQGSALPDALRQIAEQNPNQTLSEVGNQLLASNPDFNCLEADEPELFSKFTSCALDHLSMGDVAQFMAGDWSPLNRAEDALRVVMVDELDQVIQELTAAGSERPNTNPNSDKAISNQAIDAWVERTSEALVTQLTTSPNVQLDIQNRVKPGADLRGAVATMCRVNLRRIVHVFLNDPARSPAVSFSQLFRQNLVKFVGQWAHTMADNFKRGMDDVREHFQILWGTLFALIPRVIPDFSPFAGAMHGMVLAFVESSHDEYLADLLRSTGDNSGPSSSPQPNRDTASPEPRPLARIPSVILTTTENRAVPVPFSPTEPGTQQPSL